MLPVFRVDTSNAYISVSILARQGSFSQRVRSHLVSYHIKSKTIQLKYIVKNSKCNLFLAIAFVGICLTHTQSNWIVNNHAQFTYTGLPSLK